MNAKEREDPLTRSDLILKSNEWSDFVVGGISKWINLDAKDSGLRHDSVLAFKEEIAYSLFLLFFFLLVSFFS